MGFTIKILNDKTIKKIRGNKVVLIDLLNEKQEKKFFAARVNNRLRSLTYDIHYDSKELLLADAKKFAMQNGGRTGRSAVQYIKTL